jgi:hypothetical protein
MLRPSQYFYHDHVDAPANIHMATLKNVETNQSLSPREAPPCISDTMPSPSKMYINLCPVACSTALVVSTGKWDGCQGLHCSIYSTL